MSGSLPVSGHVIDGQGLQTTPFKNTKSKPKRYFMYSNLAFISEISTIGWRNDGE